MMNVINVFVVNSCVEGGGGWVVSLTLKLKTSSTNCQIDLNNNNDDDERS